MSDNRFIATRWDNQTCQVVDTTTNHEFAVCSDFEEATVTAHECAEMVAIALNFTDRWRALIAEKLRACERHQKDYPDRAAQLDNTHRVLTELLIEAGDIWKEVQ